MTGLRQGDFCSHVHWEDYVSPTGQAIWPAAYDPIAVTRCDFIRTTVAKVRRDLGFPVASFPDLVHCIARLGSWNTNLNLFFRGQNKDYLDSTGKTKLYPTIFRPDPGKQRLSQPACSKRFDRLDLAARTLRQNRGALRCHSPLTAHKEYWYSLLQHYEICGTPLLDVTQSLHVAATFALHDFSAGHLVSEGYVYVLGLPHLHGSITPLTDDQMTIVKLQSVCPPQALRPHFQEGYLVGRWPRTRSKQAGDNLAYWLVGKYHLDNTTGAFFSADFPQVPIPALMPDPDPFGTQLRDMTHL